MAQLDAKERTGLPDSAFAYVDSRGVRRLPIHDEAHVRNALARFGRVAFEDEAAQERARTRLLKAAKKHGILPIGFITGQIRSRGLALPSGLVTFLLADVEGSSGHLQSLGDRYSSLLADLRRILRLAIRQAGGREVDARGDELFAVFKNAPAALTAALAIQRATRDHAWPDASQVRVRIGLHSGRPTLTDGGYVGLAVHATARICNAAHGGQIIVSRAAIRAIGDVSDLNVAFLALGVHRLPGLHDAEELFQVAVPDLEGTFPPPRTSNR
ncbi:MAG TPA: adenylate/guanylate cyclase domain-containing protein [Candidatus Dormibacteraeota bacterium]|nr:adenylate/guanylate cyclase domain-containing protein [Candidatus Dormibacteraeota bacterium]